jgi:hypothetical protein
VQARTVRSPWKSLFRQARALLRGSFGPDENIIRAAAGLLLGMGSEREYFYRTVVKKQKYPLLRRLVPEVYRNIHLRPGAEPEEILS